MCGNVPVCVLSVQLHSAAVGGFTAFLVLVFRSTRVCVFFSFAVVGHLINSCFKKKNFHH